VDLLAELQPPLGCDCVVFPARVDDDGGAAPGQQGRYDAGHALARARGCDGDKVAFVAVIPDGHGFFVLPPAKQKAVGRVSREYAGMIHVRLFVAGAECKRGFGEFLKTTAVGRDIYPTCGHTRNVRSGVVKMAGFLGKYFATYS